MATAALMRRATASRALFARALFSTTPDYDSFLTPTARVLGLSKVLLGLFGVLLVDPGSFLRPFREF